MLMGFIFFIKLYCQRCTKILQFLIQGQQAGLRFDENSEVHGLHSLDHPVFLISTRFHYFCHCLCGSFKNIFSVICTFYFILRSLFYSYSL